MFKKIASLQNGVAKNGYTFAHIIEEPEIAKKVLLEMVEVFEKHNVNYKTVFGTLLGIYRDGTIIKGDHDMDLAVLGSEFEQLYNALKEMVEERGFVLFFVNPIVFKVIKDNVYCDLFVFDENYEYNWSERWYFKLKEEDFKTDNRINFAGVPLRTVADPEEFFVTYYGKDWRTPCENNAWYKKY